MPETALNKAMLEDTNDSWDEVDTLLDNGADPNEVGENGRNALHIAVIMSHDRGVFQRILEGINNINANDNEGNTALIIAADMGHYYFVEDIMKINGVDVNHRNNGGRSAMDYARHNYENQIDRQLIFQQVINFLTRQRLPSRLMGLKNKLRF